MAILAGLCAMVSGILLTLANEHFHWRGNEGGPKVKTKDRLALWGSAFLIVAGIAAFFAALGVWTIDV